LFLIRHRNRKQETVVVVVFAKRELQNTPRHQVCPR
jgi:hypothetical protein